MIHVSATSKKFVENDARGVPKGKGIKLNINFVILGIFYPVYELLISNFGRHEVQLGRPTMTYTVCGIRLAFKMLLN